MLFVTPPQIVPSDFLSAAEVVKIAAVHLMSPPSQWDDEITQALIREHPYVPADQVVVNFRQRDDTSGYAIGSITFSNIKNVSIPVIVSNRMLSPLDVLIVSRDEVGDGEVDQGSGDMSEDQVMPMTEENFNSALDMTQMGQPVADQDVKGVGYTEDGFNMRVPFRGRTVVAELLGVTPDQKRLFGQILSQDKQASAGFLHHRTTAVADAWLNAKLPSKTAETKLASAIVHRQPAVVVTDVPHEVKVAEMSAETIVVAGGQTKVAVKVDVVDLASPQRGLNPVLIFDDGTYCNAPAKVAAIDDGRTVDQRMGDIVSKIASASLVRGATLMFQIDGHFTRPAKLASISARDDQRAVTLRLEDDLARGYDVILDGRVKVAKHVGGVWVLPMVSKVFQLDKVAEDQAMEPAKVAEWFERRVPDLLVAKDGQFSLSVRGDALLSGAPETKMAEVLSLWVSNAEQLIETAKTAGHARFSSQIPATKAEVTKMAANLQSLPKLASAALAELRMPLDKAVKLAAAIGDPEAADMVLGTGFLTEDNLSEFVALSDMLQQVVGKLARLLLAIRMGFPGDENATVVAMKALQRVKERLDAAMTEVQA